MSHVICSSIVVTDLEAMRRAVSRLSRLKWLDKKTFNWYGEWVNDYSRADAAYKNGIDVDQYGTCDACIQMDEVEYEIGLVPRKDGTGWSVVWDNISSGERITEYIGKAGEKLMALYAEEYIRLHAERNGFMVEEQTDNDGNLVLTMIVN